MNNLLERVWSRANTLEGKKLIRFSATSVISTLVGFTTLFLVFGVLRLWGQVASTVFANIVAGVPAYYLNRTWAWGKTGRSHVRKEVLPFALMSGLGIVVSIFGAGLAKHLAVTHHMAHWEATAAVLVANVLSFAVFWVLKLLLFNRLFKVSELDEYEEVLEEEVSLAPAASDPHRIGTRAFLLYVVAWPTFCVVVAAGCMAALRA